MHIEKLLSNTLVVDVGLDLLYTNKGVLLVHGPVGVHFQMLVTNTCVRY